MAKIVPGCVRLYLKQELLGVSEWVAQINRLYYVVCPGSIVKIYVVGFKPSWLSPFFLSSEVVGKFWPVELPVEHPEGNFERAGL